MNNSVRGKTIAIVAAAIVLAGFALGVAALNGWRRSEEVTGTLRVVTSSTLLGCAVSDVGGDLVRVETLIAPASCPGHFDLSPGDVRRVSTADLVMIHGYESFIERIVQSMGRSGPRLVRVAVEGSWLIPDVYVEGAGAAADALCSADPLNAARYRSELASTKARVDRFSGRLRRQLEAAGISGKRALCADQQAEFARWLGLVVVRTFGRAEELTPAELKRLNASARDRRIDIVIDNLQSGPATGRQLAVDISAAHVTLSNFPGGLPGTDTWDSCVEENVRRVIEALSR